MIFGIVGAGSVGSRHARNLKSLGHEIVICSEHSGFRNKNLADLEYAKADSFKQLLDQRLDGVVIANATSAHAEYAIQAIRHNHNVYIEKPLTHDLASAQKLVAVAREQLADRSQQIFAVGNQHRFNPLLAMVKAIVDEDECGKILSVRCEMGEYLPFYHPDEDYSKGYAAKRDLGGGVLRTQVHDINYLQWIFGSCKVLVAQGGRTSNLNIDVEDNVNALLSSQKADCIFLHMDYLQRQPRRTLDISFERGAVHWNYYENKLVVEKFNEAPFIKDEGQLDRNKLFVSAMKNFISAIEFQTKPMTSIDDALRDVGLIDSIEAYLDI